jgi:uncharacterized iron-regulated membrane protein
MKTGRIHKVIGVILTVPLLAWSLTGIVFLIKPGYDGAYEKLVVKTHPMEQSFTLGPHESAHEARLTRTVLGYHLLLNGSDGRQHLEPATLKPKALPSEEDTTRLIQDAIAVNPDRYGVIVEFFEGQAITSTDVVITLDWLNLSLAQSGRDTRLIDTLYKMHYLQWLGWPTADVMLGAAGIVLLLLLTGLGLAGLFNSNRK